MSALARDFNAMRTVAYAAQAAQRAVEDTARDREWALHQIHREHLTSMLRPMQPWEYSAWLTGFMLAGGRPTHFYDYPMRIGSWFTAVADFVVLPLYGSLAINVFVPAGVRDLGGDTGHNNLYIATSDGQFLYRGFHDTRAHSNPLDVPVYVDTEVLA